MTNFLNSSKTHSLGKKQCIVLNGKSWNWWHKGRVGHGTHIALYWKIPITVAWTCHAYGREPSTVILHKWTSVGKRATGGPCKIWRDRICKAVAARGKTLEHPGYTSACEQKRMEEIFEATWLTGATLPDVWWEKWNLFLIGEKFKVVYHRDLYLAVFFSLLCWWYRRGSQV